MSNKLTREQALKLHYQMWEDMQKKLGDTPDNYDRRNFKHEWCREHGFKDIIHDCFLCEYVGYERDDDEFHIPKCFECPIDWTAGKKGARIYYACEENEIKWGRSPISEILKLHERRIE